MDIDSVIEDTMCTPGTLHVHYECRLRTRPLASCPGYTPSNHPAEPNKPAVNVHEAASATGDEQWGNK